MKKIFRTVTLTAIIVGAGFTVPAGAQQPVPKVPQPTPPVQRPTPQPWLVPPQNIVKDVGLQVIRNRIINTFTDNGQGVKGPITIPIIDHKMH